jgi:GNAT superfamily N-acetyltransferase
LIRRATVDDAIAIAELHVRATRAAYRGLMPDAFLDGRSPRVESWRTQLGDDARHVFVADDGARLLGFAVCGPAEDATLGSDCGELYAIYLEPDVIGRGVGRALIEAATRDLRGRGFTRAVLWVLEGNARGRRFYEAAGWRPDGATKIDTRPDHIRHELRYATPL